MSRVWNPRVDATAKSLAPSLALVSITVHPPRPSDFLLFVPADGIPYLSNSSQKSNPSRQKVRQEAATEQTTTANSLARSGAGVYVTSEMRAQREASGTMLCSTTCRSQVQAPILRDSSQQP
eukprot:6019195-Amphidinium_carterae.1